MKKEIYYCDICGKEIERTEEVKLSIDIRFEESFYSSYHINKSICKLKDFCPKCIQKLHEEFEKMGLPFENKFEM